MAVNRTWTYTDRRQDLWRSVRAFDRYAVNGEDLRRRRGAVGRRLERCWILVRVARGERCGRTRQTYPGAIISEDSNDVTCMPRAGWCDRGLTDHVVVETKMQCWSTKKSRSGLSRNSSPASRRPALRALAASQVPALGSYDSIENGERFQVKRLKVSRVQPCRSRCTSPGRAWIASLGQRVLPGAKRFLLEEKSVHLIPIGVNTDREPWHDSVAHH